MPKNENINKILVLGPSPLELKHIADYDYLSASVCKAFSELGITVVSVCSNPSFLINNNTVSASIHIEPFCLDNLKQIIQDETPSHLLSTVSGKIPYTFGQELCKSNILDKFNVKMLHSSDKLDINNLSYTLKNINQPYLEVSYCSEIEAALKFASKIGYPVKIKPLYTAEDKHISFCANASELLECGEPAIGLSPIRQISVESDISTYKKIKIELLRDSYGDCIFVGSSEKIQPYITNDLESFWVSPAQTTKDDIINIISSSATAVADSLNICGNCTFTFAINSSDNSFYITDINTQLDSYSVFIYKTYGFPIGNAYAKILLGYSLKEIDEINCANTHIIDYCAVKLPVYTPLFSKYYGNVGFGSSFSAALLSALRSAYSLSLMPENNKYSSLTRSEILDCLNIGTNKYDLFAIYRAITTGVDIEDISAITGVNSHFLYSMQSIRSAVFALSKLTLDTYDNAKATGFTDYEIERYSNNKINSLKKICGYSSLCYNKNNFFPTCENTNILSKNSVVLTNNYTDNSYCLAHSFAAYKFISAARNAYGSAISVGSDPSTTNSGALFSDYIYISASNNEEIINTEQPRFTFNYQNNLFNQSNLQKISQETGINYTDSKEIKAISTLYTLECIFDGTDLLVCGIVEVLNTIQNDFLDSYMACPAPHCSKVIEQKLIALSKNIAVTVNTVGFLNITFCVTDNNISLHNISNCITKNTSAISYITAIDVATLSAGCIMGTAKLSQLNLDLNNALSTDLVAVIAPIFSRELLNHSINQFDGCKKSLSEVVGIADNFNLALKKALDSSGTLLTPGGAFLSVKNEDKPDIIHIADVLSTYGFDIYATAGTANILNKNMVPASRVKKLNEGEDNTLDLVYSSKLNLCILTSDFTAFDEDVKILRSAIDQGILCFTNIKTAALIIKHLCKN